jgi:hypothetical protein
MSLNKLFPVMLLIIFSVVWMTTPTGAAFAGVGEPIRLTIESGQQVLYPGGENITIRADVYDEKTGHWGPGGAGVSWGQTNDVAGSYVYSNDTLTYTPCDHLPASCLTWDSVTTVVYATYTVNAQVYQANLPLYVYPGDIKDEPVKKALVWLRSQQKDNGQLGEWAVVGIATAGDNPTDEDWQRNNQNHLNYLEETIKNLNNKSDYFRSLTDYARVTMTVASAAYYDSSWRAKLINFGGVNLLAELKGAQEENGHFGKDSESQLVNSHIWAILALKTAGEKIPNADKAKEWLIQAQNNDGGWGYTVDQKDPYFGYLSDSNDTADAIRVLIVLGETGKDEKTPLKKALDFLKTCQLSDGGFFYSPLWGGASDASSDARVILALKAAGEDPKAWKKDGKDPFTHLLSLQVADGFFLYQIGMPAWDAVTLTADAVAALAGVPLLELPPAGPPSGGTPGSGVINVKIKVLGLNGAVMYPERTVQLSADEQTPLGALKKICANVETSFSGAYVSAIDGLREKQYGATSGWSYKVNGESPQVSAANYPLRDGNFVEWFYVRSVSETGGGVGRPAQLNAATPGNLQEQNKNLPESLRASLEALAELEIIEQSFNLKEKVDKLGPLNKITRGVVVTRGRKPLDLTGLVTLKKELEQNKVELSQKVIADKGAIITDDKKVEIALVIPAKALKNDLEIKVKKIVSPSGPEKVSNSPANAPAGYRQISALYNCEPDGATFDELFTLSLKVVIPPLVKPENLTLAWYDKVGKQWMVIPAVVDIDKGLILARLNHFSDFAMFAREVKKPFADVTPGTFGWAQETIEILAGAGVMAGVDETRFGPARATTRAEFASLLVKVFGLQEKPGAKNLFKDVKTDQWYAKAVTTAMDTGLVRGYEDSTFRPDNSISREEAVAILVRAINLQAKEHKLAFQDGDRVSPWARNSVAIAAAHGLVKGFPDGSFKPGLVLERAECAALIYRLLTTGEAL